VYIEFLDRGPEYEDEDRWVLPVGICSETDRLTVGVANETGGPALLDLDRVGEGLGRQSSSSPSSAAADAVEERKSCVDRVGVEALEDAGAER
jgi:hypothetical protein